MIYGEAARLTIELRGAQSVPVRTGTSQVDRVSVALVVAANREKLTPLVIYKGTRNGPVSREFTRTVNPYPQDLSYLTNQNAWMTEEVMLEWIDIILFPFAVQHGVERICLILDSFSVHLTETVRAALRDRRINTIYIPGGLTCEMQPLDVGVNAPFKHYIHEATIHSANFGSLSAGEKRLAMARSISFAFSSITQDTIVNSFNRVLFTTYGNIEGADEVDV